ncbi:MAG: hypothetical protein DBX55_05730 [Verrucomicrobia bacterium]|nr:MAG: hypothetical protein DBX55_05730 [Verrucomicrobiota bacterium]
MRRRLRELALIWKILDLRAICNAAPCNLQYRSGCTMSAYWKCREELRNRAQWISAARFFVLPACETRGGGSVCGRVF